MDTTVSDGCVWAAERVLLAAQHRELGRVGDTVHVGGREVLRRWGRYVRRGGDAA